MNSLDLICFILYYSSMQKMRLLSIQIHQRLPTMKLAVRIFALSVVVAGVAAAATTPRNTLSLSSHQSATERMPSPACGPGMPGGCVVNPSSGN